MGGHNSLDVHRALATDEVMAGVRDEDRDKGGVRVEVRV